MLMIRMIAGHFAAASRRINTDRLVSIERFIHLQCPDVACTLVFETLFIAVKLHQALIILMLFKIPDSFLYCFHLFLIVNDVHSSYVSPFLKIVFECGSR